MSLREKQLERAAQTNQKFETEVWKNREGGGVVLVAVVNDEGGKRKNRINYFHK
jgi:hypothetical protein